MKLLVIIINANFNGIKLMTVFFLNFIIKENTGYIPYLQNKW